VHSANFELMPRKPAIAIQNAAPGPPTETATATWAMLPTPTVPEMAVARAWKWETCPGSSSPSSRPITMRSAWRKPRTLMPPSAIVKKVAPAISQATISGTSAPPIGSGTKTSSETKVAIGAKAWSIA
jgi:hypothetical protein